ncbi:hypothetical protein SK3146_02183 [Paenibacillus konkukensis]|uniref:Uncharacterized protein n=1 Tax=Paenibacillus konkukensis TaxID=2020716 RepID=A0ABY4RN88_9BACL|nr:hypothetical protein [Paenibacillus konkukensis]UQZ83023.1 hypothetical protein SK3146_02183 [Paenibacillus konkukensis]
MLAEFYKTIDASEELGENISIPDHGPALYLSDSGALFCYMGIVGREEKGAHLNGWPYYLRGKSAKKSKQLIRGFYRLQAGCILLTNFLDHELYGKARFKRLENYIVSLPIASSCEFGIVKRINSEHSFFFEENKLMSRACFGLTYDELKQVVGIYAQRLGIFNDYVQYPRITRSMKKDNFCDITGLWIPPQFPYITFNGDGYIYSHVSLYGFYRHVDVLLSMGSNTMASKIFTHEILDIEALNHLQLIDDCSLMGVKVIRDSFSEAY